MTRIFFLAALLAALWLPADAADEWGIPGEQVERFEAKVVDILCELTGNCRKIAAAASANSVS